MPDGAYPPHLVAENRQRLGLWIEQTMERKMAKLDFSGFGFSHQQAHVSLDTASLQHLEIKKLEEEIKTLKIRMQSQLNVVEAIQKERAREMEQAMHDWTVKKLKKEFEQKHYELRDTIHNSRRKGFVPMLAIASPTVYVLSDGKDIVYVGQSKTPYQRIHQHKDKKFDQVRFLPCKLERMSYWEKVLIKRYKPRYNRTGY